MNVADQLEAKNIAEELKTEELVTIGNAVFEGYDTDKKSRREWEDRNEGYIKLASQVKETKTFPWKGAANVKYPLLSIASLQFSSRAHQQLFPGPNIVKGKVIGFDPQGQKRAAAERISKHMSYQLLDEMEGWEDDMDRLELVIPICGNAFKKTYRSMDGNVSELILPSDLVVNYYAKSIERASRKTHVLYFYPNEIEEQFRAGEWLRPEKPFGDAPAVKDAPVKDVIHGLNPPEADPDAPHRFLEQHTFYDLDDDGYKEPVIITIHEDTKHVVRIAPRFEAEGVVFGDKEEIIKIKPLEYFTNFIFIPATNSGVYGQAFGSLLGPLNESSNTIINQLLDAGTIEILRPGFLSRGARMPAGEMPLRPGQYKIINTPGDDIRKSIYNPPVPSPSPVLFQLLGMMLESGRSLSSVSDLMTGKSPGQNQPYSTTNDLLQQGQQVFSSIYKRIHRALGKEYRKLFALNKKYVGDTEYFTILDSDPQEQGQVSRVDYQDDSIDVIPASDPTIITNQEKAQKAEALVAFVQMGTVNPIEATRRILEARGVEDINILMDLPEPQPDPEIVLKQKELELREKEIMGDQELKALKNQFQSQRDMANARLAEAKAESMIQMVEIERLKAENQVIKDSMGHEMNKMKVELNAHIEQYKADKALEGRRKSGQE
ncbi:MAG TPA: hypothetical protein VJZ49_05310 [Syntrophales bacterium]|nr:hypothetical protein [Syntrophales bacterium]